MSRVRRPINGTAVKASKTVPSKTLPSKTPKASKTRRVATKLAPPLRPEPLSLRARSLERTQTWRRRVLLHKGEALHLRMMERADPGSLAMLDAEGMVVQCYEGTTAVTRAQVLNHHVAQFYTAQSTADQAPQSSADQLARDHLRAAVTGRGSRESGWRLRPNGSMFWAVTTIDPLLLRDGRLQGFAHVIRASAVSAGLPAVPSGGPPAVPARRTSRPKTSR